MEALWEVIQVIAAGIITLGGAGGIVIGLYRWAKKPNDSQNARLDKHDELLDNDNRRLKSLEEWRAEKDDGDKIMLKAMYALMQHAVDGNHTKELEREAQNVKDYIFNR